MPNHERISAAVVEKVEGVMAALERAHSDDGQVTADEVYEVMDLLWDTYEASMHVDSSIKASITGLRCGVASPSHRRQVREVDQDRARMASSRPRLRLMKGGKAHGKPLGAA